VVCLATLGEAERGRSARNPDMVIRFAFVVMIAGLGARALLEVPPLSAQERPAPLNFGRLPTDDQVSEWLRAVSPTYRDTYDAIVERTHVDGVKFLSVPFDSTDFSRVGVFFVDRVFEIRISDQLTGADRVRTLAFEVANAYMNEEHRQIDAGAAAGFFDAREFAVAHEIYEYEAWRLYRGFLFDLEKELGEGALPPGLFYGMATKKVREYKLPPLLEFLKLMEDSKHMKHYLDWFEKHYSRNRRQD
jgi:hypothetical protein